MDSVWDSIVGLTERLDRHSRHDGDMRRVLQILKIGEEAGEAAEAVIGVMGQNPRKGFSHTWADVEAEVCDVIITAMVALQRLTPDARTVFAEHLDRTARCDLAEGNGR
ncbi:MazG-like family protein [Streptomyces luteireticuli]|uniref:MazG-like family protein n=1 Tax=Streptomyces luteireticuli TaxID=173858 RepID=UPI0035589232